MRYTVSAREPGSIEFTFDKGTGLVGSHRLSAEQLSGGRLLWMHVLDARSTMPRAATEAVVVLHDALLEDLLDAAEALGAGVPLRRRLGPAVAVLHRLDRWFDRAPHAATPPDLSTGLRRGRHDRPAAGQDDARAALRLRPRSPRGRGCRSGRTSVAGARLLAPPRGAAPTLVE